MKSPGNTLNAFDVVPYKLSVPLTLVMSIVSNASISRSTPIAVGRLHVADVTDVPEPTKLGVYVGPLAVLVSVSPVPLMFTSSLNSTSNFVMLLNGRSRDRFKIDMLCVPHSTRMSSTTGWMLSVAGSNVVKL